MNELERKGKLIHLNVSDLEELKLLAKKSGTDVKKYIQKILQEHLNDIRSESNQTQILNGSFYVNTGRSQYEKVAVRNLVMIKAQDHYLEIHIWNRKKPVFVKGSLRDVYGLLSSFSSSIYQLSRSSIIHIDFVERISGNTVLMSTGEGESVSLTIPQMGRSALLKKLKILS